jgi:hypothetical protein
MGRSALPAWFAMATVAFAVPGPAAGWGSSGHRLIGQLAIEALPSELPSFLRSRDAISAVGELAREPDRWRQAGWTHDSDRDPAHFLDLADDGKIFGGPSMADLPNTRAAFETALRAVGSDQWRAGYLPYSIIEAEEQLAKDFAYWRAETAAVRFVAKPTHRAWLAADVRLRENLILRDLGVLAHYVGDGSQPLHVSVHFNGWGDYPNPNGFTRQKIHAWFEGDFVHDFVSEAAVKAAMTPYKDCHCSYERRTAAFLLSANAQVAPLYLLEKSGGFENGDARGRAFVEERLAAGADELRDDIIGAWRASLDGTVGYPPLKVADILGGRIDPFDALYGVD